MKKKETNLASKKRREITCFLPGQPLPKGRNNQGYWKVRTQIMLIKNWSCHASESAFEALKSASNLKKRFQYFRKCQAPSLTFSFFFLLSLWLSVSQTVSTRELGIQRLFMHLKHSITILLPSHLHKYLREAILCVCSLPNIPLSSLNKGNPKRNTDIKCISYPPFQTEVAMDR